MKKISKILLLVILVISITGCGNKNLKEISYKEYKEMIDNKETFILEVMKTGCTYCEKLKPKLEKVAKEYNIEIKVINTAKLSDKDKEQFESDTSVTGTPTIIFYTDGNEETVASRINGNVSEEKLISKFKANNIIEE